MAQVTPPEWFINAVAVNRRGKETVARQRIHVRTSSERGDTLRAHAAWAAACRDFVNGRTAQRYRRVEVTLERGLTPVRRAVLEYFSAGEAERDEGEVDGKEVEDE